MVIIAVNAGSSSLKLQLVDATPARERKVAHALVQRIGGAATITVEAEGQSARRETRDVPDHEAAIAAILTAFREMGLPEPEAAGHRIVHGGSRFTVPTKIDDGVIAALTALQELAPLHNAPGVAALEACRRAFRAGLPMVAVFDTGFHATLPEVAYRYALPHDLVARHGIRRYGFHGISYAYVVTRYAELAERAPETINMIALHLGNGASVAAIRGGRSVDTSMGFTPLEGLVMGTRSGDLDPAILGVLAQREGVGVAEVERWLNERSGLLGLSGSSDMRDLLTSAKTDARAQMAVDVFCYRARKYLGAYLAALGGARAVVFTGGIGEHAAPVRAAICEGLQWAGIRVDPSANDAASGDARIGVRTAPVDTWVIATDEERMIARETRRVLEDGRG